ncbi:MAG TPA: hypothetical protein VMF91_02115 [Bryobacteraceae bacterium]|nr:hypothetical protein [Bryobacteraceae bacterium]
MPARYGHLDRGHPYVKIVVSVDGASCCAPFAALVDTGFSDFLSLPLIQATQLGLKPHTTTRYVLADGKPTPPIPVALGFACIDGEKLVPGLISISELGSPIVGVAFLQACRKGLMIVSGTVIFLPEDEIEALQKKNAPTQT